MATDTGNETTCRHGSDALLALIRNSGLREMSASMNQKGLWCAHKGGRAHVTPHTPEALLMRLRVASLRREVKGDPGMQFVPQQLTSYSGLELLRRYAQRLGLAGRLR